jgi:hypothetical protein
MGLVQHYLGSEYFGYIEMRITRISAEEWSEALSRNEHVKKICYSFALY